MLPTLTAAVPAVVATVILFLTMEIVMDSATAKADAAIGDAKRLLETLAGLSLTVMS